MAVGSTEVVGHNIDGGAGCNDWPMVVEDDENLTVSLDSGVLENVWHQCFESRNIHRWRPVLEIINGIWLF